MKRLSIFYIIIIGCSLVGKSQMGEYFQIIDSTKVRSIDVNIVERVKDSVVFNLVCIAYYSDHNKLDSIICKDDSKIIVSKYNQTYVDSGFIIRTIYYNKKDNSEVYRIEKYIYGKESSLEYSNNKNNKGYKLTTTYDECCIKTGQLWHINDTLTIRQIIETIYDQKNDCSEFCSRSVKKKFNPYYSIYLFPELIASDFEDYRAGQFEEEYLGKQYISLSGDTIVITETDSTSYLTQTKSFSNDSLNYTELNQKTLTGFGTNLVVKWYDTRYYTRREDKGSFQGIGSDEGVKHYISITNQHGTIDYEGKENIPLNEMQMRESNKKSYIMDKNKNWVKGIFEKSENRIITVTRRINYD